MPGGDHRAELPDWCSNAAASPPLHPNIWYESDRFKVTVIPDAKGFDGSKEKHSLAGLCADAEKARIDGPLQVGHVFCGCKPCTQFDFSNCLMKREFGVLKAVECKRDTQISPTAPSQTQTLEE